jgi:outer membrane receptor protein involved in Fe transport
MRFFLTKFPSLVLFLPATGAEVALPPLQVIGERLADNTQAGEISSWDHDALRDSSPRTLDELLATEPSFSLYRRQSASFGNPTSAGVSLRNTGATAASRTLVLLDGIPQNDPFGGWISWARYDPSTLDSLRIVGPSRSAVWGNQSPAGAVQLTSRSPWKPGHSFGTNGGSFGTIGTSTWNQWVDPEQSRSFTASAYGFHTDGFHAVPTSQRGPIDDRLDTEYAGASFGGAWRTGPTLTIQPWVSYHHEERGNGTPLARNATEAIDASLRITSEETDSTWQFLAYHQHREFESAFTSVDPTRTTETIALDQYDVPAQGTGGAWTLRRDLTESFSLTVGADLRFTEGETRENAGTFRNRIAGGNQSTEGIFLASAWQATDHTALDAALRLDAWQLTDGQRTETLLADGSLLRNDSYPDRDDWEPSASLELRHQLHDDLTASAAAGTSFRLPTLNELHRPFRVRDDIVEANPQLDPERFISLSAGIEWNANDDLTIRFDAFHHWIHDAIANVPVTDPAEIVRLFGAIPPGGSGSQRQNVDLATVAGIETSARWTPTDTLFLEVRNLWTDTRFQESSTQPLLENMPFPQAPDMRTIATVEWLARENLTIFLDSEHGSSQFDDALATRKLDAFTSIRTGLRWKHGPTLYQLRIENLLDEEIQTGLASNGLLTTAAPRALWVSVDWEF